MDSVKAALDAVDGTSSCLLDQEALASTKELLQVMMLWNLLYIS